MSFLLHLALIVAVIYSTAMILRYLYYVYILKRDKEQVKDAIEKFGLFFPD